MSDEAKTTDAERLRKRLREMPGLVDVRFALHAKSGVTVEAVCAEANAMLDALEDGEARPLMFNDSRRRK